MHKTVGAAAIIEYNNKYIFEIQKSHKWNYNSNGELKIGIGCIGGSIEAGESPMETLKREVIEEISTEIDIIEWNNPFKVSSKLNIRDLKIQKEDNLFFEWHGTKKSYKKNRICVFLGKIHEDPYPGDLPGIIITEIDLLIECIMKELSLRKCLDKGMEIISKESIPMKGKITGVTTVNTLKILYKKDKTRLNHLL